LPAEPYSVADLLRVMARLRDPDTGCPWDLRQDFQSIVPSTLEEAYELAAAIEHGDYPHVGEELGDVLFQVVFYARMGEERGLFDFDSVVHTLVEKLVRRHPHVFADGEIEGRATGRTSVESVKRSWEAIKQQERAGRAQAGTLDDIPLALPALTRAQKIQKRAAGVGFDWSEQSGVIDKLREEIAEYEVARQASREAQEDELGDLLFTCVNLARHAGFDAEAALRRATAKFEDRFARMERSLEAVGTTFEQADAALLDAHWEAAKRQPGG
jgi:ATP diphosphatase